MEKNTPEPIVESKKKKKKKGGLKRVLNIGGEPVTVAEQRKKFSEWVKDRELKTS